MQDNQIISLAKSFDPDGRAEIEQTHISWVILTHQYAYKIKKPVEYSFLDFTTLAQRKRACEREVQLNRRLTFDIYLDVVPISIMDQEVFLGNHQGKIIDYAVKMRRLPQERRMDLLLQCDAVTPDHMTQIATQLVSFHKSADVPPEPPDTRQILDDFMDIEQVADSIQSCYGDAGRQTLDTGILFATRFLQAHAARILARYKLGYVVDGHGDLHSKNIFLLDIPVIFDCIEFNDHFRVVDILDELAFFCLDLELYGRNDLASHFLDQYLQRYPCMSTPEDQLLFRYFQIYRAGVKLKINCIKYANATDPSNQEFRRKRMDGYYALFSKYLKAYEE